MQQLKTKILKFFIVLVVGMILYNPIFYGIIWKYGIEYFIIAMFLGHMGDYSARFFLNKFWATGSRNTVRMGIEALSYFVVCLVNIGVAVYIKNYANLSFIESFVLVLAPSMEGKSYLPFLVIQISMIPFTAVLAVILFFLFKRMVKESMA